MAWFQKTLLLVFAIGVSSTHAMYEWIPPGNKCDSTHSYTPEPFQGVAPPMPALPNRYTMNIQANILQKAWSSDVTEYYDGPNNKAAVFLTFNGTTTQTIFHYDTMETYDIYPDGSCKPRGGKADYFGFFKMDRNHRPVKATVYEMFHMGPKQDFTYVGNTWVRGIRVNHWTSCQEWPDFSAKFQLDYYFSHEDYQTAWGMGQIPIRAVVNGSAGNEDENQKSMFGSHKFEHIYDFTAFNVGPIKDQSVFNLPHDVVCMGSKQHKPLPSMPENFQMDMEMNCPMMGGSMPFQHSLRYDWKHHMVETYMNIPSPQGSMDDLRKKMMEHHANNNGGGGGGKGSWDGAGAGAGAGGEGGSSQGGTGKGGGWSPSGADIAKMLDTKTVMRSMSQIDDHSTGLRYVTEKMNNTCRVSPMPNGEDAMPMDHGKSLFDIHYGQKTGDSAFEYQGRSTFRNMAVDVWGTDADGMIQKVFFLADDDDNSRRSMMTGGDDDDKDVEHSQWFGGKSSDGADHSNTQGGPARSRRSVSGGGGGDWTPTGRPNPPMPNGKGPSSGSSSSSSDSGNGYPGQNGPGGQAGGPNMGGGGGGGVPGRWQDMMNQQRENAAQNARPTNAAMTAKERARENAMGNNVRPTNPGIDAMERARENAMNGNSGGSAAQDARERAKQRAEENNNNNGNLPTMSPQVAEWIKNRQEQQKKNQNSQTDGSGKEGGNGNGNNGFPRRPRMHFPVLVGMVFRNRTAIDMRNMPTFFQDIMQPELIEWKEKMARNFMASAQNQQSEGHSILDNHAMMSQMAASMSRRTGELDTNVFHFQPLHTDETMFQVAQCYEPEETNHVLLHVDAPYKTDVMKNKADFAIAMRKGIADAMGVSYIHVSNLKPEPHIDVEKGIDATYVSFTLLGRPPVKAPKMKPPTIAEARRKLTDAIKNGISFKVNYPTHTKSFLVDKNYYSMDRREFQMPLGSGGDPTSERRSSKDSDSGTNYSPATVGGIAMATLIVGFIMAVAVLVLFRKRKYPDEPVIPYKITKE